MKKSILFATVAFFGMLASVAPPSYGERVILNETGNEELGSKIRIVCYLGETESNLPILQPVTNDGYYAIWTHKGTQSETSDVLEIFDNEIVLTGKSGVEMIWPTRIINDSQGDYEDAVPGGMDLMICVVDPKDGYYAPIESLDQLTDDGKYLVVSYSNVENDPKSRLFLNDIDATGKGNRRYVSKVVSFCDDMIFEPELMLATDNNVKYHEFKKSGDAYTWKLGDQWVSDKNTSMSLSDDPMEYNIEFKDVTKDEAASIPKGCTLIKMADISPVEYPNDHIRGSQYNTNTDYNYIRMVKSNLQKYHAVMIYKHMDFPDTKDAKLFNGEIEVSGESVDITEGETLTLTLQSEDDAAVFYAWTPKSEDVGDGMMRETLSYSKYSDPISIESQGTLTYYAEKYGKKSNIKSVSFSSIPTLVKEVLEESGAKAEYFTIGGVRVNSMSSPGLYIKKNGTKVEKVIIR